MSQENVQIVIDAATAYNRGDLDAWSEYFADDVDHRAVEGSIDDHGPIHGKDAMRAYLQDWLDMFDDLHVEPVEMIDAGEDQVVAVLRFGGRAKLSGVETELPITIVARIKDGRITHFTDFGDRARALEAAGLRE